MKSSVLFFLFFFGISTHAFKLSPMVAQFTPEGDGKTQSFFVENTADKRVAVQIDVLARSQDVSGKEVRSETTDFTVYPSQIVLKPRQKRTVRVMWKGNGKIDKEIAYRLVAEELPIELEKKKEKPRTNINFLLKYVASLYVTPGGAKPKVQVDKVGSFGSGDKKKVRLSLKNTGSAHKVLNEIQIQISAGGKTVSVPNESLKVFATENLLAGGQKQFEFPWPAGLPSSPSMNVSIEFKDHLGSKAK